MRGLDAGTTALLWDRLGPDRSALAFAEAVVAQVAHPPGRRGTPAQEREVARSVVRLLAERDESAAAALLVREPALLAAFFQNIDLLYAHASTHADAVSLLVMHALHLGDEAG